MKVTTIVSGTRIAALALSLVTGLGFGTLLALVTLHWGDTFIVWELLWWSFVSAMLALIAFRLAEPVLSYFPGYLIPDKLLNRVTNVTYWGQGIGAAAVLTGLIYSIKAMVKGQVASTPVELYWTLPIGVFLLAVLSPISSKLLLIHDERRRARDQEMHEEIERAKRCRDLTSLQRVEFEDQFLLAVYLATAGDMRPIALRNVWSHINHECASELTVHAIKVWRERKCISTGDHFRANKEGCVSLTAAGRDLCMRAVLLDSMQEALRERLEGYSVKNEYNFQNANVNAAVIGTDAHVHDNEFAQFVGGADQSQLAKLAQELAALRVELLKVATSAEDHIAIGTVSAAEVGLAIGHVSAAEVQARENNPQGVWEQLAKVGGWVIDAAKQVGVSLVVEAINAVFKAYNIPLS